MRRTLILVLSANRIPWNSLMKKSRETWDSVEHEQTTTLYYVGRSAEERQPRTFYSVFDEELHNIGRRTIEAYEHVLTLPDWTHLARPHSSTYVHKRRLVDYIETLPETGVFAGLATGGDRSFMWGGGHYVLSRDVIAALVENKEKWNHAVMEDVAVSDLTRELGIPWSSGRSATITPNGNGWDLTCYNGAFDGFSFTDFEEINKAPDQFFFRCKHDPDRTIDLKIMDLLFKHLTS